MNLTRFLQCFTCAIYLFNLAEFKVTNYVMRSSITRSSRYVQDFRSENQREQAKDFRVYMSFADNPFGSSTKFVSHETMPCNVSFPTINSRRPPSTRPVVSSSTSSVLAEVKQNYLDTGQSTSSSPKYLEESPRTKRGVVQLYNIVKCATGCNPLSYKGYGCYCGFLGSGQPVDPIDWCCKKHDWCYNNARCLPFFEYIYPYYWQCYKNRPICAVEHGEWGGRNSCARRLCECDRVLSECLSRYPCPRTRAFCHTSPWRFLQNALMVL